MKQTPPPAPEGPRLRARPLELLAVVIGWMIVPLLCLPDVLFDPTGYIWGSAAADALGVLWTVWHVGASLLDGQGLGVHAESVQFPRGGTLWPATPLESALLTPISQTLGAVFAFNLLQLLHVGLAGGATYALCVRLGSARLPSLAGSAVMALSPMLLLSARNGNVEVSQVYWLPLVALAVLSGAQRTAWWAGALAGVALALSAIGNIYVGIASGVVLLGVVWSLQAWRVGAVALGVAAVIAGPVLGFAASLSIGSGSIVDKSDHIVFHMRVLEGASSLRSFFIPGAVQSLDPGGQPGAYFNGQAPGTVALVLAGLGWRRWGRAEHGWLWIALAGVFLALGPVLKPGATAAVIAGRYVPLPYLFVDWFPPFSMLIELWRFSILLHLAVAVLAAKSLTGRPGARFAWVACLALVAESLVLNPGPIAFETEEMPRGPYAELFDGLDDGPIVDLPARQYLWPLYFQTLHRQTVGVSVEMASQPDVFGLMRAADWSLSELRDVTRRVGFRWLIVHHRVEMATLQPIDDIVADLRSAGLIVRELDGLTLVDLSADGPWPTSRYVSMGEATPNTAVSPDVLLRRAEARDAER